MLVGAMLLIFVLSLAGESATMAIQFESLVNCEDARGSIVQAIIDARSPSGDRVTYIAGACVKPTEVSGA
jgi:hypothetical protein